VVLRVIYMTVKVKGKLGQIDVHRHKSGHVAIFQTAPGISQGEQSLTQFEESESHVLSKVSDRTCPGYGCGAGEFGIGKS